MVESVREKEIRENITKNFKVDVGIQRERRIWVKSPSEDLIDLCMFVKNKLGFKHLSALSVTDWPKKGEYELTYHIWSYDDKILITIKTMVDRENPEIETVSKIWGESSQIHEREMHELFGVKFKGNPDLSPLFLEDWNGPAPFRKDFDWREYVRNEYYSKDNDRESAYFERD